MRLSARSTQIDFNQKYETGYCIPLWLRDLQIKDNLKRVKGRVEIGERKQEPIAIVGYGPSLKKTWEELKNFKVIITTSGAHKFLIERGIVPTYHLDVDPRAHKVKLLGKVHKDVIYTPCSTVHKTYIDFLKKNKAQIKLWHCFSADQDSMRIIPEGEYTLTGGCDAGMRAMSLARFMGYVNHHVFGMDGSYDEGYHAGYHSNPLKKVYDLEINGKVIKTSPHLKEVAKTVHHEVSMLKLDSVKFYGEGLVQELMKDAKLDKPKFAIAFQRPVLISEASRRKFERLHLKAEYGSEGFKHAETIKKMVEKCGFKSVLDYGSGKGTLATSLDFPIWEYDPAIKEKSEHPRAADLVVCTDVLDCIEEQYLEDVVCHLKSLIKQVGYFTMTGERKKWEELIGKYLHVADVKEIGDKLQFVVGPKRQKVEQPIPAPVMIQPVDIQADLTRVDWKFAA